MNPIQQVFGQYFGPVLLLLALALVLTVYVFRRGLFDRGYRKGSAANPDQVRRENPPDEWSKQR
jgi:hypothetical protein